MVEHPPPDGRRAESLTSNDGGGSAVASQTGEPAPLTGSGGYTRRRLLKIGVGGTLLAAGVYGGLSVLDSDDTGTPVTSVPVPADTFLLGTITGNALLTEPHFRTELEEVIATVSTLDSTTGLFDAIEAATGVDVSAVERATTFARYSGDSVGGAIVFETTVDSTSLGEHLEQADALTVETDDSGHRLYEIDVPGVPFDVTAAVLPDGALAVGSRDEIIGSIDVSTDEGSPVKGPVLDGADRAADGFLSVGFTLPDELATAEELPQFLEQLIDGAGIEYGYGTLAMDPPGVLTVTFETASGSQASDLASQIRLVTLLDAETVAELIDLPPDLSEDVVALLQTLSVEADGSSVRVRFPDGFALLAQAIGLVLAEI